MDMGYLVSPSARSPSEPPVSALSFADNYTLPPPLSIHPTTATPSFVSSNSNDSHTHRRLGTLKMSANLVPSVLISPTDEASSILISLASSPPSGTSARAVKTLSINCEAQGVKRTLSEAVSPSDHFYSLSNNQCNNDSSNTDNETQSKRLRHFSENKVSLSYSNDFSPQTPADLYSNKYSSLDSNQRRPSNTFDSTAGPLIAPRLASSASASSSPRPLDNLPQISTSNPCTPDLNRPRLPSLSSIMESYHKLHTPPLPTSSTNSSRSSLPSTTPPSSSLLNPRNPASNTSIAHKHRRTVSSPAPSLHRTIMANHRYSNSVGNVPSGPKSATFASSSSNQLLSSSSTASINSIASTSESGGAAMILGIPGSPVGGYKPKFKYSEAQKQVLIREFEVNQYPNFEKKDELARATGTTATQVQFWFQNQRQKVARKEGSSRPVAWVSEFVGKK
ncbi:hypothetical protein BJ741DRAFT_612971 [Chytriomyces cf. hyalinus JEL632]|nr:hypothetical protein BJ741DRAFT_612971 [Chytriomyces cf. hyalinus JEL632]